MANQSFFRAAGRLSLPLLFALGSTTACGAGIKVIYPAYETASDTRYNDLHEILQTALEKTVPEFGPYELQASNSRMNEARYLVELRSGNQPINIAWSSTSVEKENALLPLRIPLRKGLLGYRIALIPKDRQAQIDQVKTADDLKNFLIGQGTGWGDVKLYESNGLQVKTAEYDNLFKMVNAGRFDLFPRGIGEVFAEYVIRSKDNPNLAIEKNLLIYYPWPYYFFFNKKDTALHKRVEAGIRKMMADGSFNAIFKKYNEAAIRLADFKHRRVIILKNDMLPKETPLGDTSLWLVPLNY